MSINKHSYILNKKYKQFVFAKENSSRNSTLKHFTQRTTNSFTKNSCKFLATQAESFLFIFYKNDPYRPYCSRDMNAQSCTTLNNTLIWWDISSKDIDGCQAKMTNIRSYHFCLTSYYRVKGIECGAFVKTNWKTSWG